MLRADGEQQQLSSDHGVVVWDLDCDTWNTVACQLAGRNLTPDEWHQYVGDLATYQSTCPDNPQAERHAGTQL